MVKYLGPYQTVCDDWNYWWTYLVRAHLRGDRVRVRPARAADASQPGAAQQRRRPGRDRAGQRRRLQTRRWAATSTSTARLRRGRSTTRATPTARPASAATRRSSTTSTRRAVTSTPTPTRPATRGRRSPGEPTCPPARRSAAHRRPGPQLPRPRGTTDAGDSGDADAEDRTQPVQGGPDRDHRARRVHLPRVHEVRQPVREPVHDPRGLLQRERPAARLAGADRRRRRRQGRRASAPVPGCKTGGSAQTSDGRATSSAPPPTSR